MMSSEIGLIIEFFKEINKIPRCSKHEEKISEYLIDWAKKNEFEYKRDEFNNVAIKIPATSGHENKDSIAIQGHMDMVCEKTNNSNHNFSKDPIEIITDGDWLKANKTTLGADDGISLAIGLALASRDNIEHPPIELLFTADEETGMNGAENLSPGFFESKKLINIDSEDEGTFIIGCAGGEDTDIMLPIQWKEMEGYFYKIDIDGLLSGHSGIDISKNRANAIKLMTDMLDALSSYEIGLCSFKGGSARNAIPKSSTAVICAKNKVDTGTVETFYKNVTEKYPDEKHMKIEFNETKKTKAMSNAYKIIQLIEELPHGVYETMRNGITKTSNNLAKINTSENEVKISTNQRSLSDEGLSKITKMIEDIAEEYSAKYKSYNKYPSWQPDYNSELLKKSIQTYEKLFSKNPVIEVIHAGLECGLIGSKNKDMSMLSIGPTLKDVHTPNEKLYIPSLEKIWRLIIEMLKEI